MDIKGIFSKDFATSYIPNMLQEMYRDKIYAPFLEDKTNSIVLDLGANVGVFSFYAYQFSSKIYALEPAQEHFEVLEHMVKTNEMGDKIIPIKKALALEDGMASFYHNTNKTAHSLKPVMNNFPDQEEKVETIILDTLFTQYNIKHVDFMKLDVEGVECDILEGEGFKNVKDKIDALIVEYHQWSGRNPSQMVTALNDLGFDVNPIPSEAIIFGARKR
jgi:FkbM family methyltransferase